MFGGRRTGIQPRTARAGSFWETAKEPEPARTETADPLPGGTALYPAFMDTAAAEPDHDPHELTVQLASVDPAPAAGASGGGLESPDGSGKPVFVDESGRRSRRLRRLGAAVGVACSVYALVIVATLVSGNSSAPWLPLPGVDDDTPAGKVETSPVPSASASPSGSAGAAPSAGPTGSATAASSTGGATATPGATTSPGQLNPSALPEATTGTTTRNPAATATASSPTTPDSSVPSPDASQPDSGGDPSPTAVDDTGGAGEVAGDTNAVSSAT
ncbi:hypothetical protein JCM4814A_50980 [Streptomyces phaeofaciens JCM 4814]|uniref:Uncharacterized protein n=2 Tax=Streptomyces phaeofaciens TaxID=68254 RepID=A0A918HQG2_9ACTN|nr:hypothetical protein GCM10010226_78120 [Streptomyces phaeofaciens]